MNTSSNRSFKHSISKIPFSSMASSFWRQILVVNLLLWLTACGGSGGGSSTQSGQTSLATQSLSFTNNGPVSLVAGNKLNNPAHGPGSGAISYSSANPSVASVDNLGAVTAVSEGTTTITASIASDDHFAAATASYILTVTTNSELSAQTLVFVQPGPLSISVNSTLLNIASTAGSSPIMYSSSDTNIAVVSSTGLVTAISTGTVTITATKAADAVYASASASYSLTVTAPTAVLLPQTITFAQSGPLAVAVGYSFTNTASGGSGTGSITYSSSNLAVASVDAAGAVIVHTTGSATITARKAADAQYAEASATYVIDAQKIVMSAWIGPQDTLIDFPEIANGLDLYRSSGSNCVFVNYGSCADGQLSQIDGNTISDTAATLSRAGYYSLQSGLETKPFAVSRLFDAHSGYEGIVFNDQLWLIGGNNDNGPILNGYQNDVWSSNDGISWIRQNAAPFSARVGHKLISFNGKLWLIGGKDATGYKNDVWSSDDGVNWVLVTSSAAFPERIDAGLAVMNDRIWLVGGRCVLTGNYSVYFNDVWSSADGVNWVEENASAPFSARDGHQLVNFNNKLLLIGGYDGNNWKNDVWVSADGHDWEQATASAAWEARYGHQVTALNGRLWLTAGSGYSFGGTHDIWSSSDGVTWRQETSNAAFSARMGPAFLTYHNQLWVIGGCTGFGICVRENDSWTSSDGKQWTQQSSAAPFAGRMGHRIVQFEGELWLVGGYIDSSASGVNDIWSSTDGFSWTQEAGHASFGGRFDHEAVVFNNQLWIFGGTKDSAGNMSSDVWSSDDGVLWTQRASSSNEISIRWGYRIAALNNQLWLIGGSNAGNNIMSTSDGIHWVEQLPAAPFSSRYGHQVINFNGALWVIGGWTFGGPALNDVWMSTDGTNWIQQTAAAPFPAGDNYQVAVHNNELWLIGGDVDNIWSSSDGINWTHHTLAASGFSARAGFQAFSYAGYLWVIGGWSSSDGGYKNDIWRSDDGITWRQYFRKTVE